MLSRSVALGLLVTNAALLAGCPPPDFSRRSPMAPFPARTMPDVALPEPTPGTTAVVLDATDGAADVTLVRAHPTTASPAPVPDGHELCVTPCTLNMPPGRYELRFSRADETITDKVVDLKVYEEPILYRRTLDAGTEENGPLVVTGYVAYAVGGWAFWLSLIGTVADEDRKDSDWAVVTTTAAISLLGMLLMDIGAPDLQPGSHVAYKLPR
jgi:hypothetical protein